MTIIYSLPEVLDKLQDQEGVVDVEVTFKTGRKETLSGIVNDVRKKLAELDGTVQAVRVFPHH